MFLEKSIVLGETVGNGPLLKIRLNVTEPKESLRLQEPLSEKCVLKILLLRFITLWVGEGQRLHQMKLIFKSHKKDID